VSAHGGPTSASHSPRHAGTDVLVEDPTYPAALPLFRPSGSIAMQEGGIDPEEFAAFWASRPGRGESSMRVFYTVPDLHNPTGFRYSLETKRSIAALARRYDVWIIEDDHLSELEPSGIPRFLDLVPERTLWMKSLSKTTAPGIRICATSLPETLAGRYALLRSESDPGPPLWLQLFAGRFLASELYPAHLARIRQTAATRRAHLTELIQTFPALSIRGGSSGYALWLGSTATPSSDSRNEAPVQHRPWTEGARFGASASTRSCLRLSFMGIPEAQWPRALARLSGALSLLSG
jgi:DNA-binding transcriptional MocR family regulator